jgi:anti-sigma-K factor RskA
MNNASNTTTSSSSDSAASIERVLGLRPITWWRSATILCLILLILGLATSMSMFEQFKAQVAHLQKQLQTLPQIKYIAVLTDAQGAPGLLVTLDPTENTLVLQRAGNVVEGREDSLQLWAMPATGRPRSLGLLGSNKTLRIPATESDLRDIPQLAVSVESKGGVADEHGPSGDLLFRGAVIQKAL